MSGPLETSVTLEDVLVVVAAKRVPLAAELAGYLALEMAEGAGRLAGALDVGNVYVSDEGTVALVRTRKDGDAEESIRSLLARLLEAGGTQTPSLGMASRKPPGGGTAALARELEAALIPVNRAAGRRALARLAREVKRVTLGVGRNASIPPGERVTRGSSPDARLEARRASTPSFSDEEDPTTAKRSVEPAVLAEVRGEAPPPAAGAGLQRPDSGQLPTMELSRTDAARLRSLPEAVRDSARPGPDLEVPSEVAAPPAAPAPPPAAAEPVVAAPTPPPPPTPVSDLDELHPVDEAPKDEVDELLSTFGVSGQKEDKPLGRELKAMVGVDATKTPPPIGEARGEDDGAGVEALLAMSRGSAPPPAAAPKKAEAPAKSAAKSDTKGAAAAARPAAGEPPMREAHSYADERSLPTAPTKRQKPQRGKVRALDVVLGLLLATLVGAGGYLLLGRFRPTLIGMPPAATTKTPQPATATPPLPSAATRVCKASLTVEGAPEKSEILLRVGQAPVEIDHMPVGTRLEFVATADAHAPKRAIVPGGAAWEKGPDGRPRYELAVQLDPSKAKGGVEPWPPAEPGSSAGGEGAPGVVRVVSSPKGAEVWLLVGLGPEALIERLPCTGDTQVLIAGAASSRKRLVVREADFVSPPGTTGQKAARINAK